MKLGATKSPSSFYESFSDLIFATLTIFIVLVMGLALQLRVAQAEASQAASTPALTVYNERYTGAAGRPIWYVSSAPLDGAGNFVWLPAWIVEQTHHVRGSAHGASDGADPLLDLCELAKTSDALHFATLDDFERLSGGISRRLLEVGTIDSELGLACSLIRTARSKLGSEYLRWSPEQLCDALGGMSLFDERGLSPTMHPALRPVAEHYLAWLASSTGGEQMRWAWIEAIRRATDVEAPPRIQFSVPSSTHVQVGRCQLTAPAFRALLSSIRPGRDFYLECVTASGQPTDAPPWVLREILTPVGFDARVLTPDSKTELSSD